MIIIYNIYIAHYLIKITLSASHGKTNYTVKLNIEYMYNKKIIS